MALGEQREILVLHHLVVFAKRSAQCDSPVVELLRSPLTAVERLSSCMSAKRLCSYCLLHTILVGKQRDRDTNEESVVINAGLTVHSVTHLKSGRLFALFTLICCCATSFGWRA